MVLSSVTDQWKLVDDAISDLKGNNQCWWCCCAIEREAWRRYWLLMTVFFRLKFTIETCIPFVFCYCSAPKQE
jgi:hypothetical protein